MRYGFLIDQTSCIGCHACTVACKAEHDVPLGVFRTWVKYVEKGEFPNSRRHFLVERCNHCANAPCVAICPTGALFTRPDGIVDFDKDRCIGCKSCMQACPYDAIYIDPAEHTAAKCNFCAHRIDQGLQPACVLVCPEEAIIFGDLDNPASRISQLVGRESVAVRRPEQGTEPKLFYLGADATALVPEALPQPLGAMWNEPPSDPSPGAARVHRTLLLPNTEHAQVDYNVAHPAPWGWRVAAYLVAKSLAAGLFLVLSGLLTAGVPDVGALALPATVGALVFLALTTLLLVADLKRPERFMYILLKPQWGSWLTRGTVILIGYGTLLVLWGVIDLLGHGPPPIALTWLVALFAIGTAGYTALLFAQAEGRDLWQEPLVAAELIVQAVIAGAAGLALIAPFAAGVTAGVHQTTGVHRTPLQSAVAGVLLVALLAHAALIALALYSPHPTANAAWGARELTRGALAARFWSLGVAVGIALPVVLILIALVTGQAGGAAGLLLALAALAALVGLAAYDDAFVRAGQAAPLS
ncbi:MAG TPA: 4Fe-4S dicluster domain-containing protein [Ktedonobacterales bacterium]